MARPAVLKIDIVADAAKAQATLGKFGKTVAAVGAAAAAGVGALGASAVRSASAVEQAMGGVASVFGKHAATVEANARAAARTVGLSTAEYGNLAAVLGAQLSNMGTAADQLAPSTDRLVALGADLAATFGGSTADAVGAVSSLLKGERDPIERYGVSIKAADVSARLAAQGLGGLTGAARTQAEAQATLALLTEQTSAAQGAFGREGETVAGQQQRLTAIWEDQKAALGAGLLPVVSRLAGFMLDHVAPAVSRVAGELRDRFGPTVTQVAAFITGRVVPAAVALYGWFVQKIAPGLRAGLTPVIEGVRAALARVQGAADRNGPALAKLGNAARVVAEFLATRVVPIVGAVLGGAFRFLGGAIGAVLDLFGKIQRAGDRMKDTLDSIKRALGGISVPAGFRGLVGALTGSGLTGAALDAARTPGALTGSAGPAVGLGALRVTTGDVDVRVFIDGAELRGVVARQVDAAHRAFGARVAAGVLA